MNKKFAQRGSALVTLAFFMLIGAVVITAAVFIILSSSRSTSRVEQGMVAYHAAESGIDEGLLQVLRNNYSAELNTPVGPAMFDLTIAPSGSNYTITSLGKYNGFVRKIVVTTTYNSGQLAINSWQETF